MSFIKKLAAMTSVVVILFVLVYAFQRALLNENASPQWRNQIQSASAIAQGEYVCLQAEASDVTGLRKAILATNETGIWKNETEYAFMWMQPAVGGFDSFGTATYEGNVVYAPSKAYHRVYSINASNGNVIWSSTVRQCDASPSIDGDVIFVGECFSPSKERTPFPKALALNRTTGEEIWHFTEPSNSEWVGSPLVHEDYVYYTTYGSGVYALNKTNGDVIWHQKIGQIVCSVAYHNDVIFVSVNNPAGQYALNATTGAEIWHKNYGASWDSSPVEYEGLIVQVVISNASVWETYVLNETNGEFMHKFDKKGSPSTPLVYDGKVVISGDDRRISAFNLLTGQELWHTVELHDGTFQTHSYCSPAAAGGAIYYQSLNGTFYVINATDGSIMWSYALDGYGFGSISIGDGRAFVTNDAGLYAFKIGSGSDDWPMFCRNNLHRSFSENGIEYVRQPLTQPRDFNNVSNMWMTAKFMWCNKTISSAAIAWRIYFFDREGKTNATEVKVFHVKMPTNLTQPQQTRTQILNSLNYFPAAFRLKVSTHSNYLEETHYFDHISAKTS